MFESILERIGLLQRHADIVLACGVVGIVMLLIIPLPPVLLDLFLSLSIILAVTILLVTLYVEEALEFNSFPSLLLFVTLFAAFE